MDYIMTNVRYHQ